MFLKRIFRDITKSNKQILLGSLFNEPITFRDNQGNLNMDWFLDTEGLLY